ncbi:MAG: hypothetical protein M3409_10675 [Gemmatimonadota bacterium]|nr:hypothetical protein [Gemmatimonadota bacterium]
MKRPRRLGAAGEDGVALPLALLGLVAVSLMVTAMLVTSSTESAVSVAQQDATLSLYDTERALERFVGQNAAGALQPTGGTPVVFDGVEIRVAVLGTTVAPGKTERVLSITAQPPMTATAGGRTVVALVRQTESKPKSLQTQLGGALTLGGSLRVTASQFAVSGRPPSSTCGSGTAAMRTLGSAAMELPGSAAIDRFTGESASGETVGSEAIDRSGASVQQLARDALGLEEDEWLEELIAGVPADRRYGPRFAEPGQAVRQFGGTTIDVAVVDAAGGAVDLRGGSGVVIILGGDLLMRGSATFEGLVVVEGGFTLGGTSSIDGGLISLASGGASGILEGADPRLRFDPCRVEAAESVFKSVMNTSPVTRTGRTFAWFEVVR